MDDNLKKMIDDQIKAVKDTATENGINEIKITVTFEYTLVKPPLDN